MSKGLNLNYMPYKSKIFFKKGFSFAFLFSCFFAAYSQSDTAIAPVPQMQTYQPDKPSFWDRTYFGGAFALQFGDQTIVQIAPIGAYKVTEKFHVGLGINYTYYHYTDPYYNVDYTTNIYGGSVFTKYFVFDEVYAYAEYGLLNMDVFDPFLYDYRRQNISSLLVGGGYMQMVGRSVGIDILLLYDVIDDPYSPYSNPVIRIGVVAGF